MKLSEQPRARIQINTMGNIRILYEGFFGLNAGSWEIKNGKQVRLINYFLVQNLEDKWAECAAAQGYTLTSHGCDPEDKAMFWFSVQKGV